MAALGGELKNHYETIDIGVNWRRSVGRTGVLRESAEIPGRPNPRNCG
jgi:hypothetical protein